MFLCPERSVYSTAYRWTAAIPYARSRSGVGADSYPATLADVPPYRGLEELRELIHRRLPVTCW